MKSKTYQHI